MITAGDIHSCNTRTASWLNSIRSRTVLYSNYFLTFGIQLWNKSPDIINLQPSLKSLKNYFSSRKTKNPVYYNIGTRPSQIDHAWLKSGESSLSQHLFLKNIIDNPTCNAHVVQESQQLIFYYIVIKIV